MVRALVGYAVVLPIIATLAVGTWLMVENPPPPHKFQVWAINLSSPFNR